CFQCFLVPAYFHVLNTPPTKAFGYCSFRSIRECYSETNFRQAWSPSNLSSEYRRAPSKLHISLFLPVPSLSSTHKNNDTTSCEGGNFIVNLELAVLKCIRNFKVLSLLFCAM
ncbi:unnamed protein product, partial [Sphacelaria rigidula]